MVDGINLDEIKEFAKAFKLRRLSLGLTQTQVGQALSITEGPAYSQSAICRYIICFIFSLHISVSCSKRIELEQLQNSCFRLVLTNSCSKFYCVCLKPNSCISVCFNQIAVLSVCLVNYALDLLAFAFWRPYFYVLSTEFMLWKWSVIAYRALKLLSLLWDNIVEPSNNYQIFNDFVCNVSLCFQLLLL